MKQIERILQTTVPLEMYIINNMKPFVVCCRGLDACKPVNGKPACKNRLPSPSRQTITFLLFYFFITRLLDVNANKQPVFGSWGKKMSNAPTYCGQPVLSSSKNISLWPSISVYKVDTAYLNPQHLVEKTAP